ncbi:hypothetical protein [Cryptosporidium parvum Iowa II]|uniref:Uncharacterized protein n=2 Tax=Cryptosporidium parvum TaxID=5807 RepID=Q5CRG4_CRYPI|nr:hypothetical protein [Cryptosporidium parvum Iowa II]EAK87999.1 hypothetical protein cgd5_2860 [Cryptosporidium parvum Iowa II]QOY41720.1 Uncharacterized protein CPATCC_0024690 [Cryptosporidium parvum]WRK32433.1 Uncharacterized protein cpbgf_5002860 [Cryptosporidium parvum]|eukprot:QOY41720.1 hypothetical protein CPATCC_002309 [Cryptosporidium parvum]
MGRNSREEIFDRRMKTNVYDDASLEEIRGRIRRINGHRTSSLSDIKNFQADIDISALKGKDNSTILISESTLLELKNKVDESETQKHFMNALKERLKETTHEKELLIKKTQTDKEIIRKNQEEIEFLKEEISRLNGDISELKDILENSKQRIAELESCNDGNNIMTEVDMQSRIESMADCTFRNKEVKTLQDELMFNNELSSNSSDSSKVTVKSNIRHVLFNDKTEKFVGDLKVGVNHLGRNVNDSQDNIYGKLDHNFNNEDQDYECDSNVITNINKNQIDNKRNWMRIMVRLNGFIYFKSKMILIKQYLVDEEVQLLEDMNLENNNNNDNGNNNNNNSTNNSNNNSKIGKKSNNIGYSGPSENKIKMVFSPLKTEVNEIIYRLEKNGEEDEENIYNEKKNFLLKLDEQISILKEKIEMAGSASERTSMNSSRIMSFSDITTEKNSMDSIPVINTSRSSKFSDRMKSSIDQVFMINKRLLFTLVRLKLWIVEEILYDEEILDGSQLSREYDHDSSRYLLNYFENAYEFMVNLEDYKSNYLNNEYLSIGIIQMLYILNKQWERSINNENRLLNQLQEMVRIYHRLKKHLLTFSKSSYQQNSKEDGRIVYNEIEDTEIESLHLSNENNYVFQIEKELTSLGLGIFSGRDLNSGNKVENESDTVLALNSKGRNNHNEMSGNMDGLLSREQVNEILRHLEDFPDPYIANRNEILSIRELIRPLKSYGRRAPEPYIGFFAMMAQRLDNDIIQHDREIRAFQKVIKGLEDQCDRQQEELEELHEELEQLYDIIETKCDEPSRIEDREEEIDREAENGKAESGEAEDREAENRKAESGEAEDREAENGEAENGEAENGEAENGEAENGEAENGEAENDNISESDKKQVNNTSKVNTDPKEKSERRLTSQISDKEWISLCKQTSLGLSDNKG